MQCMVHRGEEGVCGWCRCGRTGERRGAGGVIYSKPRAWGGFCSSRAGGRD